MTHNHTSAASMIDETAAATRRGYHLTRIYRAPNGHTLRVVIQRDSYVRQSYAHAHVLSTTLDWTFLLDDPATRWHHTTPGYLLGDVHAVAAAITAHLGGIADGLITRSEAVLPRPSHPRPRP